MNSWAFDWDLASNWCLRRKLEEMQELIHGLDFWHQIEVFGEWEVWGVWPSTLPSIISFDVWSDWQDLVILRFQWLHSQRLISFESLTLSENFIKYCWRYHRQSFVLTHNSFGLNFETSNSFSLTQKVVAAQYLTHSKECQGCYNLTELKLLH